MNLSFNSFLSSVGEVPLKKSKSLDLTSINLVKKLKINIEEKEPEKKEKVKCKKLQTFNNLMKVHNNLDFPAKIEGFEKTHKNKKSAMQLANDFVKIEEEYNTNDLTEFIPTNSTNNFKTTEYEDIIKNESNKVEEKEIKQPVKKHNPKANSFNSLCSSNTSNLCGKMWNETDFDYKMDENFKTNFKISNYYQNNDIFKKNLMNKKWVDNNKDFIANLNNIESDLSLYNR